MFITLFESNAFVMTGGIKLILVVGIIIVALVSVMAVLLSQRAELMAQSQKFCNETREKVAGLAKDRSRPLDERRAEINRLIADTNQKLQKVDYSCEVLIPEVVGP
jgi:hypothetical protein